MPTTRVGVQAVTGSTGQVVDIDPARISATISNVGSVAVEYSVNSGSNWTSIAASGSASVSCNTNELRLRRGVAGGYPTPVDIDWTAQSEGEANSLTAAQASLVSGAGNPDLVVYGANPGGLWAAMACNKAGGRSIVLEPSRWIGGMLTGGLSATDISITEFSGQIGGMATAFYRELADEVGQRYETFWRNGLAAPPSVVQRLLRRWIARYQVQVVTNAQLVGVTKVGTRVTAINTTAGTYPVKTWIDGTYEGDLIAAAGCDFAIGREANATYGESYNGVRPIGTAAQFNDAVDPYVNQGSGSGPLLPGIWQGEVLGNTGDASPYVMSYTYRLCTAKSGTFKIPMPEPESYNALNYELLGRHAAIAGTGWTTLDGQALVVPLQGATKYDWNSGSYPMGTNYNSPECTEYVTASYTRRAQIEANMKNYILGWFKFMRTDTRIPVAARGDATNWGLCGDEFEEYGGFSPRPYVREGRRLVGDYVMKEPQLLTLQSSTDTVATAFYGMDSHHVRRLITGGQVKNEGYLLQAINSNGNPVPYRVMFPKASQCTNGMAVFAISCSHTVFGSLRMEPKSMQLGEAAGIAAAIAARRGVDVASVSSAEVVAAQDRWRFTVPGGAMLQQDGAAPYNAGTVTTVGTWNVGTAVSVGEPAHAVASASGAYKRFAPNLGATGSYDVFARFVVKTSSSRSSAAPIDVVHAGGTTALTLNQNSGGEGGDWVPLGRFTFRAGTPSANYVDVKTDGTNGTVIAAVKFVPAAAA